jgi:hypothetical protein
MVIPADKNLGLCVISRDEYNRRMLAEIALAGDSFTVVQQFDALHLREFRIAQLERIRARLRYLIMGSEPLIKALQQVQVTDTPAPLIGYPKLHKAGERMRLIASFARHPLRVIQSFIAKALEPLAIESRFCISHSLQLVTLFEKQAFPSDWLIATADIKSFYHNVDVPAAIAATIDKMQTPEGHVRSDYNCFRGLALRHWAALLHDALMRIECAFNGVTYLQSKGLPMGATAAPPLALIYSLSKVEQCTAVRNFPFLGVYFDDVIGILIPGQEPEFKAIFDNSSLDFDVASFHFISFAELVTHPVAFLDLLITGRPVLDHKVEILFEVYTKPQGAYQYIPWTSGHPPALKRALPKGELMRRLRLCSTVQAWHKTHSDWFVKFRKRGYPHAVLETVTAQVSWAIRDELRRKLNTSIANRLARRNPWRPDRTPVTPTRDTTAFVIRFDPRQVRNIKRVRASIQNFIYDKTGTMLRIVTAYKGNRPLLSLINSKSSGSHNMKCETPLLVNTIDKRSPRKRMLMDTVKISAHKRIRTK